MTGLDGKPYLHGHCELLPSNNSFFHGVGHVRRRMRCYTPVRGRADLPPQANGIGRAPYLEPESRGVRAKRDLVGWLDGGLARVVGSGADCLCFLSFLPLLGRSQLDFLEYVMVQPLESRPAGRGGGGGKVIGSSSGVVGLEGNILYIAVLGCLQCQRTQKGPQITSSPSSRRIRHGVVATFPAASDTEQFVFC